jgi:hypothetical protein
MNSPVFNRATRLFCFFVLAGLGMSALQAKPDNKLTPAEVVAKHLESIGSAEARARVHGVMIKGTCVITIRQGGNGQVGGQAIMASQGSLNLINMTFDSAAYPGDSLKFDGKKFTASQFRPGARTPLAQFFVDYDILFKEGLVGGALSSSWPLLDLQQKNPKLEYAGLKKIGGRQLHALKYTPRKGSDLKITLFFDAETFQHVRTEYEQTIFVTVQQRIQGGGGSAPTTSGARASNARINAYEEFSDFKPEGGLNLPHTYKFELAIQSETRPALVDWVFSLASFRFNEPMEAKEFSGP